MPTFTVSETAAQLPALLHRIENENLHVNICVRDADNVVAFLVSARDFPGLDVTPTVPVAEARKTFNALVRTAHERNDVTAVITRHRKPIAVLSGVHLDDITIDNMTVPALTPTVLHDHSPVPVPARADTAGRRDLTAAAMTAAIQARFPSGDRTWGRADHTQARKLMYRIFGPVCLLGNHTSYRPVIECAHLTDWRSTIAAFCADDWNQHMVEQVACYDEPLPRMVTLLYDALGEAFNGIGNVVPLCKVHHDRYDGRRRDGTPMAKTSLIERRDQVLLLPPVALNVMRELEAACYGRRTVDADQRPIIAQNLADQNMYMLKAWAAWAWQHGAYGDVDPVVRIGAWAMDLSDGRMETRGRLLEETVKFWWTGWR
ncbi:type II toxin-antitoxin system Phd/YefM family antitoxin [Glycomyces sp. A-F 0318]|uniref:type II toxin-antitoxin system Phd/YefM family antitoxin n=1 Tax=Glycomyces amatae TaxID=2881355 RepID=UPI001E51A654|nr:type II toxin-antitoxin system Phd/YefM family antitoxin [Glycomyces amatae]MCD0445800.1 type II toxin-antitoxin system Phd/YefM family antitoxin [Glycomyces amatae]